MRLSILIPALNEQENILTTIQAIRLNVPDSIDYEILLGDNGSTDQTTYFCQHLGVDVVGCTDIKSVAGVRNKLASKARGDSLLFLDADVALTGDWGEGILQAIQNIEVRPAVSGSTCKPSVDRNWLVDSWFEPLSRRHKNYINSGHMLIPKSLFYAVGEFDATLASGEDVEFCDRARSMDVPVLQNYRLRALHKGQPKTVWEFFRREIWHGIGDMASMKAFRQSSVAIAAVVFMWNVFAAIILLFADPALAGLSVAVILWLPIVMSFAKFGMLELIYRPGNIFLCGVYLFARGLSFLFVGQGRRLYATR